VIRKFACLLSALLFSGAAHAHAEFLLIPTAAWSLPAASWNLRCSYPTILRRKNSPSTCLPVSRCARATSPRPTSCSSPPYRSSYLEKEDNPDIPYYRGYSDVLVKVGETDGIQLATTLRKGTGADPYSMELDLSYPLKTAKLGNLGGYLHLQYFNGYGESLIDYNRKVRSQFRIGLMTTR